MIIDIRTFSNVLQAFSFDVLSDIGSFLLPI